MLLSNTINLGFYQINTLWLIAILSFIYWTFTLWYEGRKDGFDDDRVFDLAFSSLIVAGLSFAGIRYLFNWFYIFRPNHFLLGFDSIVTFSVFTFLASLVPVFYLSRRWKWSLYRILDIYSLSTGLLLFFLSFGTYLISGVINYLLFSICTIILYFGVLRFRGYKFVSGLIFSTFSFFLASMGFVLFRERGYLFFYPILFILGIINLHLRNKRSMTKRNLPSEFINSIKARLTKKSRDLEAEQNLLVKEDPYMQPGRAEGNSEYMDEAILEDHRKEVIDEKISGIKKMKLQVTRALGAIKSDRYGICEICKKPIDKARLREYPQATTCIQCETDKEQLKEAGM